MTPFLTEMVVHQADVCPGPPVVGRVVGGHHQVSIDQHPGLVHQGGTGEAEARPPTWIKA